MLMHVFGGVRGVSSASRHALLLALLSRKVEGMHDIVPIGTGKHVVAITTATTAIEWHCAGERPSSKVPTKWYL